MPHFQSGVNKWLEAVNLLPNGFCIKAVDQVQMLSEAKAAKPGIKTDLRHWYDNNYVFGGTLAENKSRARAFYNSFIDNTFLAHAHNVDYIEELNEYNASSHTGQELADRVRWAQAAAEVWNFEYRNDSRLSHIRLVMCNIAVGNDLHVDFAQIAASTNSILGLHPYDHWINGVRDPGSWQYYAGRWNTMDAQYRAAGYTIQWMFTEAGPFSSAVDGWKHPNVHNGDIEKYKQSVKWFIDQCKTTHAYQTGRILGFHLFTSGGGSQWNKFETAGDDLVKVCQVIGANWNSVPVPPDPPEPEPEPIPGNLLRNAGFEIPNGWTNGTTGQVPFEWIFEYYLGNNPYDPAPYVKPETRVILKSQLPAGEWEQFGLTGNQAVKAFKGDLPWHGAYIQNLTQPLSQPGKATFRFFADLVLSYNPKVYATYDPNNPAGMIRINDGEWVLMRPGVINELIVTLPAGTTRLKVETKYHYPLPNNAIFFDDPRLEEVAPTPPPNDPCQPREVYSRVYVVLPQHATAEQFAAVAKQFHGQRRTIGFSYDDAGHGPGLTSRTAILLGIPDNERQLFIDWYAEHYPGTAVQFGVLPSPFEFMAYPVEGEPYVLTSPFNSPRVYDGVPYPHEGVDLKAATGKVIVSVASGVVDGIRTVDPGKGYGLYVRVKHDERYLTWYGHLLSVGVTVGQSVAAGQYLGIADNSGQSTGSHLHLTLVDLVDGLDGYIVDSVIDPTPYLEKFS
jgi:murein DD-endopeptidase MepM/ murein hydrolase activator NlpD